MSAVVSERPTVALKGLTPLLDTVFLLVFALLALNKTGDPNRQESLHVNLPLIEKGAESPPVDVAVVFEIGADSRIRLHPSGRLLASREDMDRALSAGMQNALAEETAVEIQADRDARNGTAVALLQYLRLRGFVNVTFLATGSDGEEELFGGTK